MHLKLGAGRSRIAASQASRSRSHPRSGAMPKWRTGSWRPGPIRRGWMYVRAIDPRIIVALIACSVAAEFAIAGYVQGDQASLSATEASAIERSEFQAAFANARREAFAEGKQRGIEAGRRAARRAAQRAGAADGARRGAAAAGRQQAAIAAAAAAAERAAKPASRSRNAETAAETAETAEPASTSAPAPAAPSAEPSPPPQEPCFDAAGFPC
jgi:hypothetical protein